MLHDTEPSGSPVPDEIRHLDFGVCVMQHTQPTTPDFMLRCRRCGSTAEICESHFNALRAHSITHDVMCTRCKDDGPLTRVFEPRRLPRKTS